MAAIFFFLTLTCPSCMVDHRTFVVSTEARFFLAKAHKKNWITMTFILLIYGHFSICLHNFLVHTYLSKLHLKLGLFALRSLLHWP